MIMESRDEQGGIILSRYLVPQNAAKELNGCYVEDKMGVYNDRHLRGQAGQKTMCRSN